MKKIFFALLLILPLINLSCSEEENGFEYADYKLEVSYIDKTIEPPKGYMLIFDISESELESNYLGKAGPSDDPLFSLQKKDGTSIQPRYIRELSQDYEAKNAKATNLMTGELVESPREMLLYVYIQVEGANYEYRNMYTYKSVTTEKGEYILEKEFPLVKYVENPDVLFDSRIEYIEW